MDFPLCVYGVCVCMCDQHKNIRWSHEKGHNHAEKGSVRIRTTGTLTKEERKRNLIKTESPGEDPAKSGVTESKAGFKSQMNEVERYHTISAAGS